MPSVKSLRNPRTDFRSYQHPGLGLREGFFFFWSDVSLTCGFTQSCEVKVTDLNLWPSLCRDRRVHRWTQMGGVTLVMPLGLGALPIHQRSHRDGPNTCRTKYSLSISAVRKKTRNKDFFFILCRRRPVTDLTVRSLPPPRSTLKPFCHQSFHTRHMRQTCRGPLRWCATQTVLILALNIWCAEWSSDFHQDGPGSPRVFTSRCRGGVKRL